LASEKRRRARIQAIRELLLLESSDWAFMLRQGDMSEYANMRVRLHASRIERLTALALTEAWTPDDLSWLTSVEAHTPLFASLDEDTYAHVFDPW
jgi:1,4-alpha-glucan branching enzyme